MENKKINLDMAQIPYIVHKKRMFEAYQRETRLKLTLVATNVFWAFIVITTVFAVR